jgi:hypothetical protein
MCYSKAVSNHPSQKDCVLFFEKQGMIGFAPTSTNVGDALCQFKDTDVVAILRKVGQGTPQYEILGRGIDFLASSTKSPKPFCCVGSPGQHVSDSGSCVGFTGSYSGLRPQGVAA